MRHDISGRQNVTFFLPTFSGGGAEKIMVFIANELVERGLHVSFVAAQATGPRLSEVSPNIEIIDLKASRTAAAVIPLARYLRSVRPDALISALTHANVAAVAACKTAGYRGRVVVSERNSLAHLESGRGVKSWARNRLALWAYRSSDCIICVSRKLSDEVADFVAPKSLDIRTIYNPVDARAIQASAEEPPEILLPGRFEDRIVAVGRLTPQKGFDVLLEAFALVHSKNVRLLILGEGSERRALQKRAETLGVADRVQFTGFVANVFAVMSRSAVFVLSSRYEGMPNAMLEAIACGCRVVATDCPTGPSEILRLPEEGTLVPVEDPSALARAIENTLYGRSAVKTSVSLERFEPAKIVDQYYDALFSPSLYSRHGTG